MLLSFKETKELLNKYQIPLVESLIIESLEQGIVFAEKVGFPVVLKLLSNDVLHKVDKGLVKLNIQNAIEFEATWKELGSFGGRRNRVPSDELVVQRQIQGGVELFVGLKRDKTFGPIISFGLGGIFVEVLNDVVLNICPVNKTEALEMIKSIKGYKILTGYRGQTPVNLEKLAEILVGVSYLATENEKVNEMDINPLFAKGSEIAVADVKIII